MRIVTRQGKIDCNGDPRMSPFDSTCSSALKNFGQIDRLHSNTTDKRAFDVHESPSHKPAKPRIK